MFKVLGGRLTLYPNENSYRPAEDSFWLAALAPAVDGSVCDIGCGTGAVGLAYLSLHSNKDASLFGFDIQSNSVLMAQKATAYNNLPGCFCCGNISTPPFPPETFSLTLANPPFYDPKREMPTEDKNGLGLRFMGHPLCKWLEVMASLTKPNGHMALIIHKKDEVLMTDAAQKFGCNLKKSITLKTSPEKEPKRVILQFVKNAQKETPETQTILTYHKPTRIKYLKDKP